MRRGRPSQRALLGLALLAMVVLGSKPLRAATRPTPRKGSGAIMNIEELRALAREAGFAGTAADVAAAIAMAESGGDPCAQGDPRGTFGPVPNGTSTSFGLWQIHTPVHTEYEPARLLTDSLYSAHAAYAISRGGTNFAPWTTFRDGAYKAYMPGAA